MGCKRAKRQARRPKRGRNQLLRFNEYALCALVLIDLSFIVDIISNYGILRIATMMQSLVHVNVTESLVMLLWDQL